MAVTYSYSYKTDNELITSSATATSLATVPYSYLSYGNVLASSEATTVYPITKTSTNYIGILFKSTTSETSAGVSNISISNDSLSLVAHSGGAITLATTTAFTSIFSREPYAIEYSEYSDGVYLPSQPVTTYWTQYYGTGSSFNVSLTVTSSTEAITNSGIVVSYSSVYVTTIYDSTVSTSTYENTTIAYYRRTVTTAQRLSYRTTYHYVLSDNSYSTTSSSTINNSFSSTGFSVTKTWSLYSKISNGNVTFTSLSSTTVDNLGTRVIDSNNKMVSINYTAVSYNGNLTYVLSSSVVSTLDDENTYSINDLTASYSQLIQTDSAGSTLSIYRATMSNYKAEIIESISELYSTSTSMETSWKQTHYYFNNSVTFTTFSYIDSELISSETSSQSTIVYTTEDGYETSTAIKGGTNYSIITYYSATGNASTSYSNGNTASTSGTFSSAYVSTYTREGTFQIDSISLSQEGTSYYYTGFSGLSIDKDNYVNTWYNSVLVYTTTNSAVSSTTESSASYRATLKTITFSSEALSSFDYYTTSYSTSQLISSSLTYSKDYLSTSENSHSALITESTSYTDVYTSYSVYFSTIITTIQSVLETFSNGIAHVSTVESQSSFTSYTDSTQYFTQIGTTGRLTSFIESGSSTSYNSVDKIPVHISSWLASVAYIRIYELDFLVTESTYTTLLSTTYSASYNTVPKYLTYSSTSTQSNTVKTTGERFIDKIEIYRTSTMESYGRNTIAIYNGSTVGTISSSITGSSVTTSQDVSTVDRTFITSTADFTTETELVSQTTESTVSNRFINSASFIMSTTYEQQNDTLMFKTSWNVYSSYYNTSYYSTVDTIQLTISASTYESLYVPVSFTTTSGYTSRSSTTGSYSSSTLVTSVSSYTTTWMPVYTTVDGIYITTE